MEPWWYFIAILVVGVLPWVWQMSSALVRGWRASAAPGRFDVQRLLWVWCVFVLVFFSLSRSKLPPYILPILPALALLTAARESSESTRSLDYSAWILMASAAALIAFTLIAPSALDNPLLRSAAYEARPIAVAYALTAALAVLFYYRAASKQQLLQSFVGLAVGWFLGLALLFGTIGHDSSLRSGRDLAAHIPSGVPTHVPIYSVQTYDQTLPFYLKRTLVIVAWSGELDYGLQHEPVKGLDMSEFEERWRATSDAIAIMSNSTYERLSHSGLPMRVLGSDRRRVAVSRQ